MSRSSCAGGPACSLCGTRHASRLACPEPPPLTGSERQGFRVAAETPRGLEGYGVLLARMGPAWLSRIVTFPNVVWTVPGGRAAIAFRGRTEDEATRQAVAFIREHCRVRGYRMRDEIVLVGGDARPRLVFSDPAAAARPPRFPRDLPVRFGRNRPVVFGRTGNLSESGLFVVTEHPMGSQDLVGLLLELEQGKVPLRGAVAWQRAALEVGRTPGMGIRLLDPPTVYVRYVRALG
jgi:hypothetical protein